MSEERWWCRPPAWAVDESAGIFMLRDDFTRELFRTARPSDIAARFEATARAAAARSGYTLGAAVDYSACYWSLSAGQVFDQELADGVQVFGTWTLAPGPDRIGTPPADDTL